MTATIQRPPRLVPRAGSRWKRAGQYELVLCGHEDAVLGAPADRWRRAHPVVESRAALRFWRSNGRPDGEPLRWHTGPVVGALVLSDGRILSWSTDETLRLWSADGALAGELCGYTGVVNGALALPDAPRPDCARRSFRSRPAGRWRSPGRSRARRDARLLHGRLGNRGFLCWFSAVFHLRQRLDLPSTPQDFVP
jgi:hypothetical protein